MTTTDNEVAGGELELARVRIGQLEQALTSRVVVDVAVGVLLERHALSREHAFELLRGAARHHRRKIHDLAAEVIADREDRPEITLMLEKRLGRR